MKQINQQCQHETLKGKLQEEDLERWFIPTGKTLACISWLELCHCHILLLTIVIVSTCISKYENFVHIDSKNIKVK